MNIPEMWNWIKRRVRSMLPRASVERELGVRIAESELMKNGIELWLSMYKDEPL